MMQKVDGRMAARLGLLGLSLVLGLGLIACQTGPAATAGGGNPAVIVTDQRIEGSTVTIKEAVSPGPGWIAIRTDQGGRPGALLGYAHLSTGVNRDVIVAIDRTRITGTLYAMLHLDAGAFGVYEFPGPDAPVSIGGKVVTPSFRVLS